MKPRMPSAAPGALVPVPGPSQQAGGLSSPYAVLIEMYFRGKDPSTIRTYRRCLQDLQIWIGATSLEETAAKFMSTGQGQANLYMMSFKDYLVKEGYAPSSVNTHLVAIRSMVKIGRLLGQIPWQLDVGNVQNQVYQDTAGPGREHFRTVWDSLSQKTDPMAVRDRTILALAHDAGLRRDEIESIDLEHLDWKNGKVWVRAKKKTTRIGVSVNKDVMMEVDKWIVLRGPTPGALFTNFDRAGKGARLTGSSIDRICKKYGLGHIHGLRHLAVTEALVVTNGNIAEVMKFSRHSDPKTVMIYDDNRKNVSGAISEKLSELRRGIKGDSK